MFRKSNKENMKKKTQSNRFTNTSKYVNIILRISSFLSEIFFTRNQGDSESMTDIDIFYVYIYIHKFIYHLIIDFSLIFISYMF